ncbi:MAG: hypothetical protein RL120_00355 [Gammaproteobacteria bacterium]
MMPILNVNSKNWLNSTYINCFLIMYLIRLKLFYIIQTEFERSLEQRPTYQGSGAMGYVERDLTVELPGLRVPTAAQTAAKFILLCVSMHFIFLLVWRATEGNVAARSFVFDEDRLVENISAAVFLGAGVYAARLWLMNTWSAPLDKLALAVIAVLGLIGFLDEISFGERMLRFDVHVIAGTRIDGVHDFVEVANTLRREWFGSIRFAEKAIMEQVVWVALAFALLAVAALAVWRVVVSVLSARPRCLQLPVLALACALLAEFGLSSLIDINVLSFDGGLAMEEIGELNLAILLVGLSTIISRMTTANQ